MGRPGQQETQRWWLGKTFAQSQPAITKETAPCCLAKKDSLGRFQPGFCGDDCVRRVQRDEWFRRAS